jgi:hypothetical protein
MNVAKKYCFINAGDPGCSVILLRRRACRPGCQGSRTALQGLVGWI